MQRNILKLYLAVIYILGFTSYLAALFIYNHPLHGIIPNHTSIDIMTFIILSVIGESLLIKYKDTGLSSGFAVHLCSFLLFGILWSITISGIGIAFRFVLYKNKYFHVLNTPIYKTMFNVSIYSISGVGAYYIFLKSSLITSFPFKPILPYIFYVLIFIIINVLIVSFLQNILIGDSFIQIYNRHIKFSFLHIVFVTPFGILLYYLYLNFKFIGAVIFLIPIIAFKYIFKLYIEQ